MRRAYEIFMRFLVTANKKQTILSKNLLPGVESTKSIPFYADLMNKPIINLPGLKEVQTEPETWRDAWIPDDSMSHIVETKADANFEVAYAWVHLDAIKNDPYYNKLRGPKELFERAYIALNNIIIEAKKQPNKFNDHLTWIVQTINDYLASSQIGTYSLDEEDYKRLLSLKSESQSLLSSPTREHYL